MTTTKLIAVNTLYQIVGKVLSMSVTVLATAIITRYYGVGGYGAFSLMQNWPALFFVIADFGLNAIAVRELTLDWSKAGKYLGTILVFRIFFSLVIALLLGFVLQLFPYNYNLKLGIILGLFLILTQALYTTLNIFFQVKQRYDLSVLGYVLGYVLILGFILYFSYLRIDVMWVNFSYVIGGVFTFFFNLILLKNLGVGLQFEYDPKLLKELLVSSLPLGLMFLFSQINFKIDSIFLSVLKLPKNLNLNAEETLGLYGLAYKIFEVALVVPTFFMNAVYPVLVAHMALGPEKLWNTFKKVIVFLAGAGLLTSLGGILFSRLAIDLLGGPEFGLSLLALRILLVGMVLYFLTQPVSWLIVTLGKQSYLPWIYLVSAIFNVSANYYFIPRYSFYASSVITHTSEFLILVMLLIGARAAWKKKYA
jgi:O-antigen/teichoic acid export membrane protein